MRVKMLVTIFVTAQGVGPNQALSQFGIKGLPNNASRIAPSTGTEFFLTVEI